MKRKLSVLIIFLLFFNTDVWPAKKKAEPKTEPVKKEEKLDLIERVKLVLKFGNTAQVIDSIKKIPTLKEEEQKSLVPELGNLMKNNKDPEIQAPLIQLVGDVKWNDLDNELVHFLKSEDPAMVTASANAIRKKKVTQAIEPLKELIQKADFTKENSVLNDLISTYAVFQDPALEAFLFEKLKDEKVLNVYKSFILKYLGTVDSTNQNVKEYLLDIVRNKDKDLNLRISSVRALGSMGYTESRDELRKQLDEIESMSDKEEKKQLFFLRLEIITALVKLKDDNVKPMLVEMTRDDDESVRLRAIKKLSEFKSNEFIELLEYKSKYDGSPAVQRAAKKALAEIRGTASGDFAEDEKNP